MSTRERAFLVLLPRLLNAQLKRLTGAFVIIFSVPHDGLPISSDFSIWMAAEINLNAYLLLQYLVFNVLYTIYCMSFSRALNATIFYFCMFVLFLFLLLYKSEKGIKTRQTCRNRML